MKRLLHLLLMLFVFAAGPAVAQQLRIGYVDMKQVLDNAPQVLAGREKLDLEFRPRGPLTYSANFDTWQGIAFWDALDFIGVSAYFPLSDRPDPTLAELEAGWDRALAPLERAARRWGRPVVLTEAGFPSIPSAARAPWREERTAVKAAGRYLSLNGHAVLANTSAAMYRARGEQALLLCEPDGQVLRASANGYELLAQASGCPVNRRTVPDEIERCGRDLIRQLLADATLHASRDGRNSAHVP